MLYTQTDELWTKKDTDFQKVHSDMNVRGSIPFPDIQILASIILTGTHPEDTFWLIHVMNERYSLKEMQSQALMFLGIYN